MLEVPPASTAGDAVSSGGPDHGSRSIQDRLNQTGLPDIRKRKDERALDKDEEDYFNEDRYITFHLSEFFMLILDLKTPRLHVCWRVIAVRESS